MATNYDGSFEFSDDFLLGEKGTNLCRLSGCLEFLEHGVFFF